MKRSTRSAAVSVLFVLSLFASAGLYAQLEKKVDGAGIKDIILTIASDKFMGRETGTPGCTMAEEYFAGEYKKLKLSPAGENGTYFFTYPFSYYKVEPGASLIIDKRIFYYGRGEDFRVESRSEGGDATGEVVFAGYGIHSPAQKRDDYENLDVSGKIVLVRRGCPSSDWAKWRDAAVDSQKAAYCRSAGALGMLFFDPQAMQPPVPSAVQVTNALSEYKPIGGFPVFRVEERVARFILQNSDPPYNALLRKIDTTAASFRTGRGAAMSARVSYERERKVRDVLAMIPGSDRKLKDQAVVIGGHLDHVGTDMDGKVNYGADDNASGPSVTLGIARAMVKSGFRPKRTVIFTAWSGEEEGLLGAAAWCKKPTWDMKKIVCYFNLDMVGVGEPKLNFPGMYYGPEIWDLIKQNTDTAALAKVTPSRGGPGGSDHTPFLQKGVPAFFGITGGPHPDYHTPGDRPEKIGVDIVQFVGDFMYHCVDLAANSEKNFLSEERNGQGKFKLATIYNLAPVGYGSYKSSLSGRDIDVSTVSLASGSSGADYDGNFLRALRAVDEAIKSNQASKEFSFVQNPNEAAGLSYQNKMGLIASADLGDFNYSDVLCRALARAGVKIGIVGPDAPFAQDTADKAKVLRSIADGGMIIMLKDFPAAKLLNTFSQVEKPLGVIGTSISSLSDAVAEKMKAKGHLFIYAFPVTSSVDEILKTCDALTQKLGAEGFTVAPGEPSDAGFSKFRDVYLALDKKNTDEDTMNKIFSDNIRRFFTKAMQETTQRAMMGRPF